MNTSHTTSASHARRFRAFHTPVRGHTFASRPTSGERLDRSDLTLRREPDNPADPYAVAVWADGGGTPWRVGYLERAVAIRLCERLGDAAPDAALRASFAGWWEEPHGRWQRPVLRLADAEEPAQQDTTMTTGLAAVPPFRQRRTVPASPMVTRQRITA